MSLLKLRKLFIVGVLFFGCSTYAQASTGVDLTAGNVSPTGVYWGDNNTFNVTISNAGDTATPSGSTVLFEISPANTPTSTFAGIPIKIPVSMGVLGAGNNVGVSVSFATSTAGYFYIRACANTDTGNNNLITESNYGNNCGTWKKVNVTDPWGGDYDYLYDCGPDFAVGAGVSLCYLGEVVHWSGYSAGCSASSSPLGWTTGGKAIGTTTYYINTGNWVQFGLSCSSGNVYISSLGPGSPPDVTLTATPTVVTGGSSSALRWWSMGGPATTTCIGTGFSTGNASTGVATVFPVGTQTYTVTCTDQAGSTSANVTVVATPPAAPTNLQATSSADGLMASTSWTGSAGATSYSIQMSPFGTCPNGWASTGGSGCSLSTTTTTVVNIPTVGCTTYQWSVVAVNASGNSPAATGPNIVTSCLPNLTAGTITPTTVVLNTYNTFSGTVTNSGVAGTGGTTFYNFFQKATGPNGSGLVTDLGTTSPASMSNLAALGSSPVSTSTLFSTSAVDSMRLCTNKKNSGDVSYPVVESVYTDNCGPWTNISVVPTAPTNLQASSSPDGTLASTSWTGSPGATSYIAWISPCPTSGGWTSSGAGCTKTVTVPAIGGIPTASFTTYQWAVSAIGAGGSSATTTGSNILTSGLPDLTVTGSITPTTATQNLSATFSGTITNIGTTGTGSSFPYFFQSATGPGGTGAVSDLTGSTMSTLANGNSDTASLTTQFSSVATYSLRLCADMADRNGTNRQVTESNEGLNALANAGNNCGSWTNVVVSAPACNPAPGAQCTGSASALNLCGMSTTTGIVQTDCSCAVSAPPNSYCTPQLSLTASSRHTQAGGQTTLNWSAQYVTSCMLTGPGLSISTSTPGSVIGFITPTTTQVSPTGTQAFTLTCGASSTQVTVGILPLYQER